MISVLKGMFCDKKLSFNYSDIPIQLSSDWLDKILPIFQAVMIKYDRVSGVREIITKLSNDDKFIADYIMDSFQAQIQVDYNPDNDDILYFADYLLASADTPPPPPPPPPPGGGRGGGGGGGGRGGRGGVSTHMNQVYLLLKRI